MALRVIGDLSGMTIIEETTYGNTGTNVAFYGGTLKTFRDESDAGTVAEVGDGTMKFGTVYNEMHTSGYTATFTVPASTGIDDWITYAIGATSGLTATQPSFETEISVASDQHYLYSGCKINNLTIRGEFGKPIELDVEVFAKKTTISATRKTAKKTKSGSTLMHYNALTGGGKDIYNNTFELSINRELLREGTYVEADTKAYASGIDSIPTAYDVDLNFSEKASSSAWDILRLDGGNDKTFAVKIGTKMLTMTGCYFVGKDSPSRTADSEYDDSPTVKVRDISYT